MSAKKIQHTCMVITSVGQALLIMKGALAAVTSWVLLHAGALHDPANDAL
jgi:hypothetical protein